MDDIKIEQQKEFLRQLNREFKRLEDNLKDLKEELKNSIDEDPYTIVTFGLAKKSFNVSCPKKNLSTAVTSLPDLTKSFTNWVPMYPPAPVTNTFVIL